MMRISGSSACSGCSAAFTRIEALTRHYGVQVLVGEATRAAAGERFAWVEVDTVRVKGKQQSVTLFTPVLPAAGRNPPFDDEMRLWQLALASYRLQHWNEAQATLQGLLTECAGSPLIGLYRQFLARTTQLRSMPPAPDWDGAHTFDIK